MIKSLNDIEPIRMYLVRIGAEPRSLRTAVVKEQHGAYWRDLATVRFKTEDGTISASSKEIAPTSEEAEAIKSAILGAKWPRHQIIEQPLNPPAAIRNADTGKVFEFRDVTGKFIMYQLRIDPKPGEKAYIPYTFWDDGEWRIAEPDGKLPLYNLNKIGNNAVAFLHEGAKAASYVQWMIDRESPAAKKALSECPWVEEISNAIHLGWIGGALSPYRTDWSVLRERGIVRVYAVADNDKPGIDAVSLISQLVGLPMTVIRFDDRFSTSFDLADPFPVGMFNSQRHYVGPTFADMCHPATWATEKQKKEGPGAPLVLLRQEFVSEWIMSNNPHVFINRFRPWKTYSPDNLNTEVAPFSEIKDVASKLASELSTHVDSITYQPQRTNNIKTIITIDGARLVNTYRPPAIKPVRGAVTRWLEFMEYLIPDKGDREKLMKWCATLIARPDIRMLYGVLLISEQQGVGKSSLGNVLAQLVGIWNTSFPDGDKMVESAFNGWAAEKRLAVVQEIYAGKSRKGYDKLKSVMTDSVIEVNRKYVEAYTLENWLHIFACSNDLRALHLDGDDRRWLVPAVTDETKPPEWWRVFYDWLNSGGLAAIAAWAADYVEKFGAVATGEHAPITTMKQEVIAASRSEGRSIAFDIATAAFEKRKEKKIVLVVEAVRDFAAGKCGLLPGDPRMDRPRTLRKEMLAAGLKEPPKLPEAPDNRIKTPTGWKHIVANFEIKAGSTWAVLRAYEEKAEEWVKM